MINFIRNNFYRMMSKKYYVIISLIMIVLSISTAIYFTSKQEGKASIAVVTQNEEWAFQSNAIQFTIMEEAPPKHQLVLGKYDGVIVDKGNENYTIETIKNDDFRGMLEEMVKDPGDFVPIAKYTRGLGTNIIGYLLMVVLLQSMLFMFVLAEDIESKQIERIAAAPVSFIKYLLSHFVCIFILIFVPVFSLLIILKGILGLNIGFSLWQYGGFIGLIAALGIAFAMFIHSLVKGIDTANMIGSSTVVLTSILSGSFYSFDNGNELLGKILWILPQKSFLSFAQGVEKGMRNYGMLLQLSYVGMLTLLFLTFSVMKIKKDYILRRD